MRRRGEPSRRSVPVSSGSEPEADAERGLYRVQLLAVLLQQRVIEPDRATHGGLLHQLITERDAAVELQVLRYTFRVCERAEGCRGKTVGMATPDQHFSGRVAGRLRSCAPAEGLHSGSPAQSTGECPDESTKPVRRSGLKDELSALLEDLAELASSATGIDAEKLAELKQGLHERVEKFGTDAKGAAQDAASSIHNKASETLDQVDSYAHAKPWHLVIAAGLVGLCAGCAGGAQVSAVPDQEPGNDAVREGASVVTGHLLAYAELATALVPGLATLAATAAGRRGAGGGWARGRCAAAHVRRNRGGVVHRLPLGGAVWHGRPLPAHGRLRCVAMLRKPPPVAAPASVIVDELRKDALLVSAAWRERAP